MNISEFEYVEAGSDLEWPHKLIVHCKTHEPIARVAYMTFLGQSDRDVDIHPTGACSLEMKKDFWLKFKINRLEIRDRSILIQGYGQENQRVFQFAIGVTKLLQQFGYMDATLNYTQTSSRFGI